MDTNLLILLIAGGVLAWKLGLLDTVKPPPPPGGGDALTEEEAAIIVARNRPDICPALREMSGGYWNCENEANTINTIKHWFYVVDQSMVPGHGTLVEFVKRMGWS